MVAKVAFEQKEFLGVSRRLEFKLPTGFVHPGGFMLGWFMGQMMEQGFRPFGCADLHAPVIHFPGSNINKSTAPPHFVRAVIADLRTAFLDGTSV